MFNVLNRKTIAAGVMAATMILSAPVTGAFASAPAGSSYAPVQLHAAPTKQMTYYKTGDGTIPNLAWVTTKSDLTFLPSNAVGDVNAVVKDANGVYWIGTQAGLQRVNFAEADASNIVQYMAGPRYLYGGDDNVLGLASDNAGGIWVKTASGVTHIAMKSETLLQKTDVYEQRIKDVHDRRGMVTETNFTFSDSDSDKTAIDYNSPTGQFVGTPSTSDNDGLWTAMYAMGEIFRYNALKNDYGATPTVGQQAEIAAAKAAALRATKAVMLLDYVSGRGNGFPSRSYMLTSENEAITNGDHSDYSFQNTNGFWFHSVTGQAAVDAPNPNGIIPSMVDDQNRAPIGYSIVRVTGDAMKKSGSRLFPSGGTDIMNYNGLGLSQEAINKLNETRPDGSKLGTDIKTLVATVDGQPVYQVMPVITNATNNNSASTDKTTSAANKPVFQLTVPVYEQIPTFFNDLFPASAIGADGHVDQNQIVYKADTSSDEVDGHYALFFTAYKYLCDDVSDPQISELKDLIAQTADRMTNLILKNDNYYIQDATGKATQWSRWLSQYFNDGISIMSSNIDAWAAKVGIDANGDDALSYGYEDGPLNALEVMAAFKTAAYVTAADYPQDSAKFQAAYDKTFDGDYSKSAPFVNGKGYINMALDYAERRLVRQATNAYNINDNQVVTPQVPGYTGDIEDNSNINGALHNDWTQYVNYSDEELGWFPVYQLVMLETDPARHAQIVAAYDQWFENEKREQNPFYTFLYQLAHPNDASVDLKSAVNFLYDMPEFRITFGAQYDRQDVFYIEPGDRDDYKQTNYVLPTDERKIIKDNNNPFESDDPYTANGNYNYKAGEMDSGTVFTLPYWFGRLYGMIKE